MSGSVRPLAPSQASRAASFRAGNALGAQRAALYPRQHRRHSCRHLVAAQQAQTEAGELCAQAAAHAATAWAWCSMAVRSGAAATGLRAGDRACLHALLSCTCQIWWACGPAPSDPSGIQAISLWADDKGPQGVDSGASGVHVSCRQLACAACLCGVESQEQGPAHTLPAASALPPGTALPQHPVWPHS